MPGAFDFKAMMFAIRQVPAIVSAYIFDTKKLLTDPKNQQELLVDFDQLSPSVRDLFDENRKLIVAR
jgi:hypothetical protein